MYKAIYDFVSDHKNILSFKAGEKFVKLDVNQPSNHGDQGKSENPPGWVYVINEDLINGFVPETYIHLEDENAATFRSFVKELIMKAQNLSQEDDDAREKIRFLKIASHLRKIEDDNDLSITGCNDMMNLGASSPNEALNESSIPSDKCIVNTEVEKSVEKKENGTISNVVGCELVEDVKRKTGLGHKQTLLAVESTLEFLINRVPSIKPTLMVILASVKDAVMSDEALEATHDWQRLKCIFSTIVDVKSNVEQLNWALHEDQHIIIEFLEELVTLLTDGDLLVIKKYLEKDEYRDLEALVQYFSMETRPKICNLLLKVFAAFCTLNRVCIKVLVYSNLPLLLARDMKDSMYDYQKFVDCCLVLTMLLWTGEPLPVNHYGQFTNEEVTNVLDMNFVTFILTLMDDSLPEDSADLICDRCTELLLAYNLQFADCKPNIILQALKSMPTVKEFFGKLIALTNREEDPVGSMFDHEPSPQNAVHKMLIDVFGEQDTANMFYTNDLKVFIEIVARKLLDLSPEDKTQTAYLRITHNLLCNTNYADHCHCQEEFQKCFSKILHEDTDCPKDNQAIVEIICEKLPTLFHL